MRKLVSLALKAATGLALVASANAAHAATRIIDPGTGKLVGAVEVMVGGASYSVNFVDGTCAGVFGSCAAGSFAFTDATSARAAADALLGQVFTGVYTLLPGRTQGCSLVSCLVLVPYAASGSNVTNAFALNNVLGDVSGTGFSIAQSTDTSTFPFLTYAAFTADQAPNSSAVPEPSTWMLMMAGFGIAGFVLRRSQAAGRRVAFG